MKKWIIATLAALLIIPATTTAVETGSPAIIEK